MGVRDLFFSIFAKDETAAAFGSVKRKLNDVDGAARSVGERFKDVGGRMQDFGARASVASGAVVLLFHDAIGAADASARAFAKVEQAVKQTGGAAGFTADQLADMAGKIQATTRFDGDDVLNKVTAQLLTFGNVQGDVFSRAQIAATDLATMLDGDLQSASIMLGKALQDPVKGINAMSRAGVSFSAAQQAMIKDMVASGDVIGAQTLILDELSRQYGGQAVAARAAGAGILDAWTNTWGDVKEVVGGVLIELLPPVIDTLQGIADAFQALSPETQKFVVIAGGIAVVLPPVIAALGLLVAGIGMVGAPVAAAIAGFALLTAGIIALWEPIKNLASAIGEKLSAAFTMAMEHPGQFALKLGELALKFSPVGLAAQGMWSVFSSVFPQSAQAVAGFAASVKEQVLALPDTIIAAFGRIGDYISATVDRIGAALVGKLNGIMESVAAKVEWVEGKFFWLYDRVVGNSWVPDLVDEIGVSFGQLNGNMVAPTNDATAQVDDRFAQLGQDVAAKMKDMVSSGNITWRGFMSGMLDVSRQFGDRIISEVFDKLGESLGNVFSRMAGGMGGDPLSAALSAAGVGGVGGGGGILGAIGSFLGFAEGGAFRVGGRQGRDRNAATVALSADETVHVTKRGSGGNAPVVNVYIQTPDPAAFSASRAQIGRQVASAVAAAQRAA